MSGASIRRAQPGDAAAICAIVNPLITSSDVTFTTEPRVAGPVARQIEESPGAWWVAERIDGVIGFASFGPFRAGPGYVHCAEHSIYLTQAARGGGHGRALMETLCEAAREARAETLIGAISGANRAAIAFHAACGFAQCGRLPRIGAKFGRRLDLVLMQRFL